MKLITVSLCAEPKIFPSVKMMGDRLPDGRIYICKRQRRKNIFISNALLLSKFAHIERHLDDRNCEICLDEASVELGADGEPWLVAPQLPDAELSRLHRDRVGLYFPSGPITAKGIRALADDAFARRLIADDLLVVEKGETALVERVTYGLSHGPRVATDEVEFDGFQVIARRGEVTLTHRLTPAITFA